MSDAPQIHRADTPEQRRALHWTAIGYELSRCARRIWFHLRGIWRDRTGGLF